MTQVVDRELRALEFPGLPEGGATFSQLKQLAAMDGEVAKSWEALQFK